MSRKKRINKKNKQKQPENNDSQADKNQALGFEKAKTMTIGELNEQKDNYEKTTSTEEAENSDDGTKIDSNILSDYIKNHQSTPEKTAKAKALETQSQSRPYIPALEEKSVADDISEEKVSNKNNKLYKWLSLGLILIALIAGIVYAWNFSHSNGTTQTTKTASLTENVKKFNAKIQAFYIDQENGQLKNSAFANLDSIKSELKSYTDYQDYASLEKKVNTLSQEVQAIEQVNQYFNQPAIVDGKLINTVTVKENQNLQMPEVDNEKLKALLNQAVALGKAQQSEISALSNQLDQLDQTGIDQASLSDLQTAQTLYSHTSAPIQGQYQAAFNQITAQIQTLTDAQKAAEASANNQASGASPSTSAASSTGNAASSANTNSAVSESERQKSRVPYDQSKINDANNSAWTWGDGIKEKVIALCQSRGYIGNDYILEKVNIINGNGYYNLFSADGRYLVSINCKTGYFVGNGAGHSDDLDY